MRAVNELAFGGPSEADIIDAVRPFEGVVSLVAAERGRVIGHILFTTVRIDDAGSAVRAAGLGPMAVAPDGQRQGVGSRLVRAGLDACRAHGYDLVVVVGHPDYYPRFGFVPAGTKGLRCEYPVPPEAFMVLELRPGASAGVAGVVRYLPEFTPA